MQEKSIVIGQVNYLSKLTLHFYKEVDNVSVKYSFSHFEVVQITNWYGESVCLLKILLVMGQTYPSCPSYASGTSHASLPPMLTKCLQKSCLKLTYRLLFHLMTQMFCQIPSIDHKDSKSYNHAYFQ